MDIEFRPCTSDDCELAVPLIISSGPAIMDYIFADELLDQTQRFVRRAFKQRGMELSHQIHTAMIMDGDLVGVGAIWQRRQMMGFTLSGARQIVGYYGLGAGLRVISRALQAERIVKPPRSGVCYIGHLGVSADYQSKGLGTRLITALMDMGRGQGFSTFGLDVSARNPRAQQLYERLGFVVKSVNPADYSRKFGKIVEHRYMELTD